MSDDTPKLIDAEELRTIGLGLLPRGGFEHRTPSELCALMRRLVATIAARDETIRDLEQDLRGSELAGANCAALIWRRERRIGELKSAIESARKELDPIHLAPERVRRVDEILQAVVQAAVDRGDERPRPAGGRSSGEAG